LKRTRAKIKVIVFDLGRVVLDFDHHIAAERMSRFTDKTPRQIFNLFFDSELTRLFEAGRITPKNFFLVVEKTLKLELSYRQFLPIWNQIFFLSKKNTAVYRIASALKEKYRLAILSNINILHFNYIKKNFPVLNVFHHFILSYKVGVIKPEPLIYRKALQILSVSPENVFYADDRSELVEGAKALGIRAFVFQDPRQLKRDLLSCGVNMEPLRLEARGSLLGCPFGAES
jgi:putative hydrolase of the HAD superfamily